MSLLILASCYYDEDIDEAILDNTIVSYTADIQTIFNNNCTSCHPLIAPAPDLTDGISYTSITTKNYVVPNDLDKSILYQKLIGNPNVMPPSGPLPQKEIDLVKKWIEQGALNN